MIFVFSSLKNSVLLLAQDRILQLYKMYEERGSISPSELSTYYSLIKDYQESGGNSEIVNVAKASISKLINANTYTPNEYRLAMGMDEVINPLDIRINVQAKIDYNRQYSLETNIYPEIQSRILDSQVQCDVNRMESLRYENQCRCIDSTLKDCLFNHYVLYADNMPVATYDASKKLYEDAINTMKTYEKKRLTIYDLDRLIFPDDPIRDWVEKKTAEINKKFAWADEFMERMDI